MISTRTVYLVKWATNRQRLEGILNESKPYETKQDALFGAKLKRILPDIATVEIVKVKQHRAPGARNGWEHDNEPVV